MRARTAAPEKRVPHLAFHPDQLSYLPILPLEDVETAYYLRLQVEDRPVVLADITRIFGEAGISIEAVLQKEPAEGETNVSLIMLTQCVKEQSMNGALAAIEKLDAITGEVTRIRMESLG